MLNALCLYQCWISFFTANTAMWPYKSGSWVVSVAGGRSHRQCQEQWHQWADITLLEISLCHQHSPSSPGPGTIQSHHCYYKQSSALVKDKGKTAFKAFLIASLFVFFMSYQVIITHTLKFQSDVMFCMNFFLLIIRWAFLCEDKN